MGLAARALSQEGILGSLGACDKMAKAGCYVQEESSLCLQEGLSHAQAFVGT